MAASKKEVLPVKVDDENVEDLYERFLNEKMLIEGATERLERLKKGLLAYAEDNGVVDDAGHNWVELPNGLKFQRQKRKSESLNAERIQAWLEDVGREDDVVKEIQVFDEDKFWAVVDDEELTQAQIDAFYDVKETYAFVPGDRK